VLLVSHAEKLGNRAGKAQPGQVLSGRLAGQQEGQEVQGGPHQQRDAWDSLQGTGKDSSKRCVSDRLPCTRFHLDVGFSGALLQQMLCMLCPP